MATHEIQEVPDATIPDTLRHSITAQSDFYASHRQLVIRYNNLIHGVTEIIRDHESCSGCDEGKAEAAGEVGIAWRPAVTFDVTFSVTVNSAEASSTEGEFDNLLRSFCRERDIEIASESDWSEG